MNECLQQSWQHLFARVHVWQVKIRRFIFATEQTDKVVTTNEDHSVNSEIPQICPGALWGAGWIHTKWWSGTLQS